MAWSQELHHELGWGLFIVCRLYVSKIQLSLCLPEHSKIVFLIFPRLLEDSAILKLALTYDFRPSTKKGLKQLTYSTRVKLQCLCLCQVYIVIMACHFCCRHRHVWLCIYDKCERSHALRRWVAWTYVHGCSLHVCSVFVHSHVLLVENTVKTTKCFWWNCTWNQTFSCLWDRLVDGVHIPLPYFKHMGKKTRVKKKWTLRANDVLKVSPRALYFQLISTSSWCIFFEVETKTINQWIFLSINRELSS